MDWRTYSRIKDPSGYVPTISENHTVGDSPISYICAQSYNFIEKIQLHGQDGLINL